MKTLRYLPVLLILTVSLNAQHDRKPKERVDAMKIGFITDRLNLTSEEAKQFWPVYDAYENELETLRKDRRENLSNARRNFDEMSDSDLEKAVDNEIKFRQNELDVLKKYHPQFKKILPVKKVARLYKAEEDFKRKLLEMVREKRQDRPGR